MEGFPWDDLRKILLRGHSGQGIAMIHSGEEILPKVQRHE